MTTTNMILHDSLKESTTWSSTLSTSVETIWIGEDVSEIDFQLVLPPEKLGFVICADLFLTLNRSSSATNEVNNKKQEVVPFQLTFAHNHESTCTGKELPILEFDPSKIVEKHDLERQSFQLASILNAAENVFVVKVTLHMKSLPDDVDSFVCSLDFTTNDKFLGLKREVLLNPCDEEMPDTLTDLCTFKAQSCAIKIAKLKLCIQTLTDSYMAGETTTTTNTAANRQRDDIIEWYCKHGGDNTCIDVMIHLKDRKGSIVHNHPDMSLSTELVYEDGSPLIMHRPSAIRRKQKLLSVLPKTSRAGQEQQQEPESFTKTKTKSNQVYRPMRPEPILLNGDGSIHFAFRIEDVSANHKPHTGFKLKVLLGSPPMADGTIVYGGLMDETIIVKSRPTTMRIGPFVQDRSVGGRTTILQKVLGGIPILGNISSKLRRSDSKKKNFPPEKTALDVVVVPITAQRSSSSDNSKYIQVDSTTQTISFDMECINSFFCGTGIACLSCGEKLKVGECLSPSEHKLDCRLFLTLSPLLIHSITDFGNGSCPAPNNKNA